MSQIDILIEEHEELERRVNKYPLFNPWKEEYRIDIARIIAIKELQKITAITIMTFYQGD